MKKTVIEMNSHRAIEVKDRLIASLVDKKHLALTRQQLDEIGFALVQVLADQEKTEGFEIESDPGRIG